MPSIGPLPFVEIYTDGGCKPNPGPGGWGAVLISGSHVKEIYGSELHTTNNRMEMTAAIEALRLLKKPCEIELYTDSQYLRRGITEWLPGWQRRNWTKANGNPVENVDLWKVLLAETSRHHVDWHWIRGHRGNRWNERADQLATQARRQLTNRNRSQPHNEKTTTEKDDSGEDLPTVALFGRGSALGSPGPAGYAAIIVGPNDQKTRSGGWPLATSEVMQLWAVIAGLQTLEEPSSVTIHTPSTYVIDGATKWLASWERSGWRTSDGHPVKNRDLWEELDRVMGDHDVRWEHLPSGKAHALASQAALLAREEAEKQKAETGS